MAPAAALSSAVIAPTTRGSHSSTSQLNVNTFVGYLGWSQYRATKNDGT